eukprot:TRINITY_DN1875_c0_g1_i1.p1 TRINITY_DN1875_c0_g1~~TRINITY_DN1875_c0_g1_i1.p1  ORF type:complete len:267 (-),score=87.82 TRINITY_DN1875_c0_g1_i1:19-819(-)
MARNEEKSQSMLNRYLAAKNGAPKNERRPYLASLCESLPAAERWRRQILREISQKITAIQNTMLGEHKIRDLNDEINKLMRIKHHWEKRIVELGGSNYAKSAPPILDANGQPVRGKRNYFYFGAAKDLPGVKELFEAESQLFEDRKSSKKKSRHQLYKGINHDYYGMRDDDDGLLVELESEVESKMLEEEQKAWDEQYGQSNSSSSGGMDIEQQEEVDDDEEEESLLDLDNVYQPLPSHEDLEQELIERQKEELKNMLKQSAMTLN